MGHAGFLAVGGYASGIVTYYFSMHFWNSPMDVGGMLSGTITAEGVPFLAKGDLLFLISLLIGGLVAALLGFLVGLPSLRLKGDYLALVTLGFGEIVRVLIQQTNPVLDTPEQVNATPFWKIPTHVGGALGFTGLPTYTSHFWVFMAVAVTVIVAFRLKSSTFGRAFLSIREDEIASEAMGVNTTRYKVWAFVIAAFFAGIAGGLFSHTLGVGLSAEAAGFLKSFDIIIMVVLGGLGSISGAIAAAIVVTLLPELMRDPDGVLKSAMVLTTIRVLIGFGVFRWLLASPRVAHLAKAWSRKIRVAFCIVLAVILAEAGVRALVFLATWSQHNGIDLSQYRMIIYALALILIMIFRPKGIFGVREVWDRATWSWLLGSKKRAEAKENA
jgi:branched-chain amino acid transport system permease protein